MNRNNYDLNDILNQLTAIGCTVSTHTMNGETRYEVKGLHSHNYPSVGADDLLTVLKDQGVLP